MHVNLFRPARLMSFVLAASMIAAPAVMAADTTVSQPVMSCYESDAPVTVSAQITGTALGVGYVEALGVNVRENPNMEAEVLGVLGQGQQVIVLSQEGDWYRVTSDGVTGFVRTQYMTLSNEGSAELGYGLIRCSAANIRLSPDTESDAVGCLAEEEAVTITGVTDGWYQIDLDGETGYVRSDLVDPTADIPAEKIFDYAVIECSAANIRTEPDSSAEKIDVLYSDSRCVLVQQVGDWYEVQYGKVTGYVYAPLTSTTNDDSEGSTSIETFNEAAERQAQEEAAAAAAAAAAYTPSYSEPAYTPSYSYEEPSYSYDYDYDYDYDDSDDYGYEESYYDEPAYEAPAYDYSTGSSIVSVAEQYIGVPYVWGGTSPSGFDCSGFVQYVFRQCGYYISRTADTQYYDGYSVSYSDLQPGDLVFFVGTYATSGISHVGIYIGGGQFIHAASGGVKISSLSESYYSSRYYSACRII